MINKTSQSGSALATGLVLLTVMSLVSLSTLEGALVQTNLATNTQLKVIAFQEAETALKEAATANNMIQAMIANNQTLEISDVSGASPESPVSGAIDTTNQPKEIKTTIEYCGILPSQNTSGMSLDANQSATDSSAYVRYVFDITSTVNLAGDNQTQAQHTQRSSRLMMNTADNTCI